MFSTRPRRRKAFTLIELLVVIAIIALLMGLVFPALSSAIRSAKKNKAATETKNIAAAVELFERDYGYLPIPRDTQGQADVLYDEDVSKQIFLVLMGEDQTSADPDWDSLNYKNSVFLDMDTLLIDGTLEDPWGSQYQFLLDRSLDQRVTYEGNEYRKKALVLSPGPDRDLDEEDDNISNVEF